MQEVPVVQRLQAEVVELQIAIRVQCRAQLHQVELQQRAVEQLGLHAFPDEVGKVLRIATMHVAVQHFFAEDF